MEAAQDALRLELAELQQQVNALGTGDLAAAVKKLQDQVAQSVGPGAGAPGTAKPAAVSRVKIGAEEMSAEVVDTNPYSRLMALQRMGIVKVGHSGTRCKLNPG